MILFTPSNRMDSIKQPEKPAVTIQFRNIFSSDYNKCVSLIATVFNPVETVMFRKIWKQRRTPFSFIALVDSQSVGCAIVTLDNCIQYIAIDPDFQELGIGSQLLRKICEEMSDQPSIWLKTADSPWLRKWYETYGFVLEKTYMSKTGEYQGDCMIRIQRGRNSQGKLSME